MPWHSSTHQQLKTRTSLAITTATFELQILKINIEIYNLKSRSRSSAGPPRKDGQQRHEKKDIKPAQDSQNTTTVTGKPGKDIWQRTVRT
jgi:hypothetical protein